MEPNKTETSILLTVTSCLYSITSFPRLIENTLNTTTNEIKVNNTTTEMVGFLIFVA